MSKRRLAVTLLLLLPLLVLGAPARALAEESATTPATARNAVADARARGEIRWGNDSQGGAPYVFQDPMDPNHLIGFEVDFAAALANKLGVRARPVQGPWDGLLELLARGDFDVVINGIEVAEEKKRVADLSRPYYVAAMRLTVRKGDVGAPRTLVALRGRKVGTLPGSLAARLSEREGAEVKTYDGGQNDIYDDLRIGRTDAVLLDDPITLYYGAIDPALEVVDGSFGEASYAVGVPKGDTETLAAVNGAIDALAKDGTLAALYARWGLWNEPTEKLLGGPKPPSTAVAEAHDAWRAAVGKPLPFWSRVTERYPATIGLFARGALLSLVVSVLAMAVAVTLGMALALARVYGPKPLQWLAVGYIELFRGTPLLVQLTMVYFGLPELGLTLSPFVAGVIALGLNYAAAEAENYRAGLGSVPAGQMDAARTLGLSKLAALRHVALPQAIRVALPPTTNDFIALLKDSSLISVVTLTELTKTYTSLASAMRDHLGLGLVVALFYLGLSLPFARLSRSVEERLGSKVRRPASA
ncbi:ABC transporter substrate-binding protein/permease [Polyangium sp. 6x1]|uniref:ABC transporter substrate-binding protein/permease n=1 Tax=Polyangium sp. 6x1 TaxID=3042689 RepID=UPI00248317B3|nr:ABC transporter substrate-binding protein/permease [Polyangium sp. 6x1]MDI1444171.1 ABC transporter substrate-binding protein/permease [Polyangium sp. 6x1]